jgi:hypothetical protein
MIHDGEVKGLPLKAYNDTKTNIEALSAAEGMIAYATDTDELGFRKTSAWEWMSAAGQADWSNTIIVAGSGGDYTTISTAVSAAIAGQTILVMPATYQEALTIDKAISLIGFNKEQVMIKGTGTGDQIVLMSADGAVLENLNIRYDGFIDGDPTESIYTAVKCTNNARIRGCDIYLDAGTKWGYAVNHTTAGTVSIDNCYMVGYGDTLGVAVSSNQTVNIYWSSMYSEDYDVLGGSSVNLFHCIFDPIKTVGRAGDSENILWSSHMSSDESVINPDFTGSIYVTKSECQTLGMRFSDSDTPYPDPVGGLKSISGSWSISAGNGWKPAASVSDEGPAIMIPLVKGQNWEFEVIVNYAAAGVSDEGDFLIGYLTPSGHIGAYANLVDDQAAATQLVADLYTNDGDDTYTSRYTGSAISGTGQRTFRLRNENSCIRFYDHTNGWQAYTGHQSTGVAYHPAYVFVQTLFHTGTTFWTMYVESIKIMYLL